MAQFYKIEREEFTLLIKYNPEDESTIQIQGNNLVLSKGKLFGWQDSSKEEFDSALQKFMVKLQTNLKK